MQGKVGLQTKHMQMQVVLLGGMTQVVTSSKGGCLQQSVGIEMAEKGAPSGLIVVEK